ncbi:hypothetical protein [Taibaiella koreensis]|uniref:hypothetical protein n=1 Tax=Taibaiella koreensis TaxID=1268548 RepID=UPI000E59E174|nr:hypothetical protein [Taibaiella koreensis]
MKDIKALLEKYYNGETSLEEERRIQNHFAQHPGEAGPDAQLFQAIDAAQSGRNPARHARRRFRPLRYLAIGGPALAAGMALWFMLRQADPSPQATRPAAVPPAQQTISAAILVRPELSGEIQDEQQALEQARKALAYVSSKLNKGVNGIGRFSKLEQSISKIQTKEKS